MKICFWSRISSDFLVDLSWCKTQYNYGNFLGQKFTYAPAVLLDADLGPLGIILFVQHANLRLLIHWAQFKQFWAFYALYAQSYLVVRLRMVISMKSRCVFVNPVVQCKMECWPLVDVLCNICYARRYDILVHQ